MVPGSQGRPGDFIHWDLTPRTSEGSKAQRWVFHQQANNEVSIKKITSRQARDGTLFGGKRELVHVAGFPARR